MIISDKATGHDGITDTCIKLGFQQMQKPVFHLFHLCFAEHNVPLNRKLSYSEPLYRGKGSKTESSFYRGISLLCCMYKFFTVTPYQRLRTWFERNLNLPPNQDGF